MTASFFNAAILVADFTSMLNALGSFIRSGGVFMWFIIACSIAGLAAIIYKVQTLREGLIFPEETVDLLEGLYQGRTIGSKEVISVLQADDSPLGRTARAALLDYHTSKEEAFQAASATARQEIVNLERGISLLESVVTAGPLFGLLGTVAGLGTIFNNLKGSQEASDPAAIAPGIAEALNTTIAGLVVAIPCVFAHSHFTRRIDQVAARLEVLIHQALSATWQAGGPSFSEPPKRMPIKGSAVV